MSIHIYKGYVIAIEAIGRYAETTYVGDIYYNGDIINTRSDPDEVGVLSICITYIDNLGDDEDE